MGRVSVRAVSRLSQGLTWSAEGNVALFVSLRAGPEKRAEEEKRMAAKTVRGNQEAFEIYKTLFGSLNRAMNAKFHLEAVFIEYAIFEDRTTALLRHIGHSEKTRLSLARKINRLANLRTDNKNRYLVRYFAPDFFAHVREWNNSRNQLVHALAKKTPDGESWRTIAEDGREMARMLSSKTKLCKHAVERAKAKTAK